MGNAGKAYSSTYDLLQIKREVNFYFGLRKSSVKMSHIKPSEHDQHINIYPLSTSACEVFL